MAITFDLKALLEIVFKVTKKNSKILAHQYLLKDVSIISKWRNNVVQPGDYDISKIVDFVDNQSTSSQKLIIRSNIEELLKKSLVKDSLKDIVLSTKDFNKFLKEVLIISVSGHDQNSDIYCSNKVSNSLNTINIGSKIAEDSVNSYTAKIELDLMLPEGSVLNLNNIQENTDIEFTGRLNLSPTKKLLKVATLHKRKAIMGGLFIIFIITSATFIFTTGNSNANSTFPKAENNNTYSTAFIPEQNILTEADEPAPSSPSPTPQTVIIPTCSPEPEEPENKAASTGNTEEHRTGNVEDQKKEKAVDTTIINNSFSNLNFNISGENQTIIVGENNIVSCESE